MSAASTGVAVMEVRGDDQLEAVARVESTYHNTMCDVGVDDGGPRCDSNIAP